MKDGRDLAYLSYSLALIERRAPVSFTLDDLKTDGMDRGKMYKLLAELEFTAQIKRLGLSSADTALASSGAVLTDTAGEKKTPASVSKKAEIGEQISFDTAFSDSGIGEGENAPSDAENTVTCAENGAKAVDLTFPEAVKTEVSLDGISVLKGKTVGFAYDGNTVAFATDGETFICRGADRGEISAAILENGISLVLHDSKRFCSDFATDGVSAACTDDVMLAAYVLNPAQSSY